MAALNCPELRLLRHGSLLTFALAITVLVGACGRNAEHVTPAAGPTATPVASSTSSANSTRPFRGGEAQPLQPDTVVYYETVCADCDQEVVTHLYRVSVDSSGTSRTDDLLTTLTAAGAQALSLAGAWERGDAWAVVCEPGRCADSPSAGGEGGALYHSSDGGVSWEWVSAVDQRARLVGAGNGHAITAMEADGQPAVYYQEPEHVRIEPPYWNYTRFTVVQEFGTFWRATRADGSLEPWFYSTDLKPYLWLDSPQPGSTRWIQSTARGQLLEWQATAAGVQPAEWRIGYVELSSTIAESWSWMSGSDSLFAGYERLDVAGATPDGSRIFGTLVAAGGTAARNRLVFIDADSGVVRPIDDRAVTVAEGDEAVMLWALEGNGARVTPAGTCAELRWSPELPSPVYACAAAGVLVRRLDKAAQTIGGVTWVAVKALDWREVWIDQRNLR